MNPPPRASAGPTPFDWLVLSINVVFVAGGIVLLARAPDVGIVTIAFFGTCAFVAAHQVLRKRAQACMAVREASLVGGELIRPSRTAALLAAAWITVLGGILAAFGGSFFPPVRWIGWLLALLGIALLARLPRGYVQLDPEGITIAGWRSWCLLPWDRISGLAAGSVHRNDALLVYLNGVEGIVTQPPSLHASTLRWFALQERWFGAPVVLMTAACRLPLPHLVKALERYVTDPGARGELARPRTDRVAAAAPSVTGQAAQ